MDSSKHDLFLQEKKPICAGLRKNTEEVAQARVQQNDIGTKLDNKNRKNVSNICTYELPASKRLVEPMT